MSGSRREFLVAAGAAAGGLGAYPGAVAGAPGERITVAESDSPLWGATAALERERPDVGVETIDTDGFGAFVGGEADVQHAARPMTADERESAHENGIEFEERELPVGGVAALGSRDEWCRCLSAEERGEFTDGSVETWSEVASTGSGERRQADLPESGTAVLVRGIRAAQYAIGHGGVGYHEAAPAEFEPAGRSDDAASVVRLGFAYVARDARDRPAVAALVDSQDDVASEVELV